MRTVLRVAGLTVQSLHDRQVDIVANQISGVERAGLHASTQLHCNVDVRRGSDAVSNNAHSLVHHRDQDAVYHKARAFLYANRGLTQRSHQIECGLEGLVRSLDRTGNLNQLHDLSRVEEVAADDLIRTLDGSRQLGGGQSRGVGGKNGVCRADIVQLLEQFLLQVHALEDNFHHEVSVSSRLAVDGGLETSQQLILVLLGDLFLLYHEGQIVGDGLDTAIEEFLLDVDHGNVMAIGQKYFCNACTHVASAEYTNFHDSITSLSLLNNQQKRLTCS